MLLTAYQFVLYPFWIYDDMFTRVLHPVRGWRREDADSLFSKNPGFKGFLVLGTEFCPHKSI
jgi:hypothetical protein